VKTPRIPLFASLGEDVSPGPLSPTVELGYPLARALGVALGTRTESAETGSFLQVETAHRPNERITESGSRSSSRFGIDLKRGAVQSR